MFERVCHMFYQTDSPWEGAKCEALSNGSWNLSELRNGPNLSLHLRIPRAWRGIIIDFLAAYVTCLGHMAQISIALVEFYNRRKTLRYVPSFASWTLQIRSQVFKILCVLQRMTVFPWSLQQKHLLNEVLTGKLFCWINNFLSLIYEGKVLRRLITNLWLTRVKKYHKWFKKDYFYNR